MINIWLDDVRTPPDSSWTHVRTAWQCIALIGRNRNNIQDLSLDHDLGDDWRWGTGYTVARWLEEADYYCMWEYLPKGIVTCHSANPAGKGNIRKALQRIDRIDLDM